MVKDIDPHPIGEEIDWERIRKLLPEPGFKVLPRRWVVERTFSCIDQNRRMSKDYEVPLHYVGLIYGQVY